MSSTCVDCGTTVERRGRRGPPPKRCKPCFDEHERNRRGGSRPKRSHTCKVCGCTFSNGRKTQHACSPQCRKQWSKAQQLLRHHSASCEPCGNPSCSNTRKHGTKYCCAACRESAQHSPLLTCQNPDCGKLFRMKNCTKNPWKNKGKYCTPECYRDHRWGKDRPRKKTSLSVRRAASSAALATSLRKKCKVLNVTFDPACTREAVLSRDKWVCQHCGLRCNKEYKLLPGTRTPDPRNAEHDHIIPLSVPGSLGNVFENSQCLCRKCNMKKGNTSCGQLRLPIEEDAWGKGVRVRRQPISRFLGATLVAVP
jgi:5-methylcytosine-specific restriction endonuclease McrA